jgi:hypothetical protein
LPTPFLRGIKLAAHLPQSCREALQECHRPGLLADIVRQIHAALLAAHQIIELGDEVSHLMDQPAARGRADESRNIELWNR